MCVEKLYFEVLCVGLFMIWRCGFIGRIELLDI